MALARDSGLHDRLACDDLHARNAARGWTNLRPVEGGKGGPIGQWIDLLASISHELRTPLNAVIGFSDAMSQEVFGPIGNERYQEYVRHIRSSGVELLAAAEDALAMTAVLAQPKATVLEDVEFAPLVANALDDVESLAAGRLITFDIDVPPDLAVRGDRRLLPRAIRQMAAVGLSRAAPGSRVAVTAIAENGLVVFRVEVPKLLTGAPPVLAQEIGLGGLELGLGRRELAVWLAMALLDLLDCRLTTVMEDGRLSLDTTLEQSVQGRFFVD